MRNNFSKIFGVMLGAAVALLAFTPPQSAFAGDLFVGAGGVDYSAAGPDSKSLTKSNGCSDSKTPCGSITHATAFAKSGDVINLSAGTFGKDEVFPLFIRKGVTLQGSLDGSTIIEGNDTNALVIVEAASADIDTKTIIRNIKIRGNQIGAGLSIGSGSGSLQNGLIKSGGDGMNEAAVYGYYSSNGTVSGANIYSSITGVFISVSDSTSANVSLLNNRIYSNNYGVYVYAYLSATANVNMRSNSIFNNSIGVFIFASDSAYANVNMTNNQVYSNSTGVYVSVDSDATANVNMRNNDIFKNDYGVYIYADSSAVANVNMTNNKVNSNTSGVYAYATWTASINLYLKNNSISSNNWAGVNLYAISGAYVYATLTKNYIANNSTGLFAENSEMAYVYAYLKNNIFSGNSVGLSLTSWSSVVAIYAGPYGARTGLNTFNNTTNVVDGGVVALVTTNNWWDAGEATYNIPANLPLDNPLLCTVAPATLTTTGGAVTVSAASALTYFVDRVGAAPKRLTVNVGGSPGGGIAVAANQSSVSFTAPAMVAGIHAVTVTNAGGQVCVTSLTYEDSTIAPITITINVTDGRGGRTTKTLTLTPH